MSEPEPEPAPVAIAPPAKLPWETPLLSELFLNETQANSVSAGGDGPSSFASS